jgi:hypothetical protein
MHKIKQKSNKKYLPTPYTYVNPNNQKNNKISTQVHYKTSNYNYYNKKKPC